MVLGHSGRVEGVESVDVSDLAGALGVAHGRALISLVGGGGKSTSLFALGRQLAGTTILTTTTKMGAEQSGDLRVLIRPTDDELRHALTAATPRALVWKGADGHRALGVDPADCTRWFGTVSDNVVVEADGSRRRPFKAPADYEPVVPSATTLLVACLGVGAFGRPIAQSCHRPERVAALARCRVTDLLTPARAAAVLRSPAGSQKARPPGTRFVVTVHGVTEHDRRDVEQLAAELGDSNPVLAVRPLRGRGRP